MISSLFFPLKSAESGSLPPKRKILPSFEITEPNQIGGLKLR
jgi:hypothetical protein